MSKSWRRQAGKDHFRQRARAEGYRSRAAYKLKQIVRDQGMIGPGDTVVDLGAAPGGWTQVAVELVGADGRVVAVDLKPFDDIDGATIFQGDVTRQKTLDRLIEEVGQADVVISDMAPRISGAYSMDHARSIALAEAALGTTDTLLRPGGRFIVKVFQGDLFKRYFDSVGIRFNKHRAYKPKASRSGSSEVYVLGIGFRGPK